MISLQHVRRQKEELRRLFEPPLPTERPEGAGIVRFLARCPDGAVRCLEKAREVMSAVLRASMTRWPEDEEWKRLVPAWFVARCAEDRTREEEEAWNEQWRKLPRDEQIRVEATEPWSLLDWLHWLQPSQRQWWWWDAIATDQETLKVAVNVEGWPFPWGALRWLLQASGAAEVTPES